jgi:hypothetical protein
VKRLGTVALALALTVAGASCGGDSDQETDAAGPAPSAETTAVAAPTSAPGPTIPSTNLTLRITDVRLAPTTEDADNTVRILLPSGVANASVTVTGAPASSRAVSVCQTRELDKRLDAAQCRTPNSGEAVSVSLGSVASGVELAYVPTPATGATGSGSTTVPVDEVTIRYTATSREVRVRLPQIAIEDAAGRPTFALTPPSTDGGYRATLSWAIIAVFGGGVGTGQLELVQGGNVVNQAQASADTRLTGTLPNPGTEAAIRARNVGTSALVTPKLTLLLP